MYYLLLAISGSIILAADATGAGARRPGRRRADAAAAAAGDGCRRVLAVLHSSNYFISQSIT